jgi:hypothetical protein
VDREQTSDLSELGIMLEGGFQIRRDQRGLPIMAMDEIGLEIEGAARFQDGLCEKGKPLRIIRIVPVRGRIQRIPLKKPLMLDEVDGNSRCQPAAPMGTSRSG